MKRRWAWPYRGQTKDFYPTYEALKRINNIFYFFILNYFYPTYEALKLSSILSNQTNLFTIFTLPMRHWNSYLPLPKVGLLCGFLPYLWGIETIYWLILFNILDYFYPTYEALKQFKVIYFHFYLLNFYPTYEALKPMPAQKTGHTDFLFLPYLWGIETPALFSSSFSMPAIFTLPMRHWNCKILSSMVLSVLIFTLPMRHWNFKFKKYIAVISSKIFTLPMRHWNLQYFLLPV